MLSDRLKLNDDKTEFVIIGTNPQLTKVNIDSLTAGDYTIAPSSEVKNLGCWLDNQLKMTNTLIRSAKPPFIIYIILGKLGNFLALIVTRL